MSQSETHANLIREVATAIGRHCSDVSITTDLQQKPGDNVPPLVNGFRPDVYARLEQTGLIIIAEAKTDKDIDNQHTLNQTRSFINYLNDKKSGLFILSVTGHASDHAKTMLYFVQRELPNVSAEIEVFDGCDFWRLDSREGVNWHLI